MLNLLLAQRRPRDSLCDMDVTDPTAAIRRARFLRRVRASLPREWMPVARRGLTGVSAHLPAALRHRLFRLAGTMSRDMGAIEQSYPAWCNRYDGMDDSARRRIMADIARMPRHPLISVVMPVFNPASHLLRAAIHSVQDQFYPWWELCIADDASTDPAVIRVLLDAQALDHRIKLVRRSENGHISAASNSALKLATGPFVALLDHDDILAPQALYQVAARILAQPDVDLIYSDEDHIGMDGQRHHPYFKPDWDPELNLGQNLVSHMGVYRRELVEQVGGFRLGLEGSQDHDLALRVAAESHQDRIAHIPQILYHWRQGATGQTFSEAWHDRCVMNARRAVQDQLAGGAEAVPAPLIPVWTRVIHPLPVPAPLVSVVIDAANCRPDPLARSLRGLLRDTRYPALEVLVLNGNAPGGDPRVRVLQNATSNEAAATARGSLLLLLDAGLWPADQDWLHELASQAIRPGIGAVGAKLLAADGQVLHAGIAVGGPQIAHFPFLGRGADETGYFGHLQLVRCTTAVTTACLMVQRQSYLDAGGLDEGGLASPLRDIDFCLRLTQSGTRNLWTPYARLTSGTAGMPAEAGRSGMDPQAVRLMKKRWGSKLDRDPFWNPNLTLEGGEIGLAFPPRDLAVTERQAA